MNFSSYFAITTHIKRHHVFKSKAIAIGLFSFLMLFSFVQTSEAELLELIIDLNVEKEIIISGDTVVVTGSIVNHAYDPVRSVEVLIRTGTESTKTFTNPEGMFRAEFKDFQRIPGIYTVNVVASGYEMTGLTSTQFRIAGDISPVSVLQDKLDTDEARKYLGSKESDFEKNPIGQILFKYYHELLDELILEQGEARKPLAEQIYLEQQRQIADDLRNQAIEEYTPGYGIFDGYAYESYIDGLNSEIKDLVVSQLEFTKNIFEKAQKIKEDVIANGGTIEEARQAYLDMLSIPKETLEQFNQITLDEQSEISDDMQTDDDSEE